MPLEVETDDGVALSMEFLAADAYMVRGYATWVDRFPCDGVTTVFSLTHPAIQLSSGEYHWYVVVAEEEVTRGFVVTSNQIVFDEPPDVTCDVNNPILYVAYSYEDLCD